MLSHKRGKGPEARSVPTFRGSILARDHQHGGDDLLHNRGGHGACVRCTVGTASNVINDLLCKKLKQIEQTLLLTNKQIGSEENHKAKVLQT